MTGKKLYENALALLGIQAENGGEYLYTAVAKINQVLGDVFDAENSLRIQNGKEALTEIPEISLLGEILPVSEKICREIMAVGLAAYFSANDDPEVFNWLNSEYKTRIESFNMACYLDIQDVY